jgi:hypothetical protein
MAGRRNGFGRALALIAVTCAMAFGARAATPVTKAWTADPEAQYLLDVNLRRLTLGDGVRAYQTPEGTCVVFGDFLTALDVPMKIDLASKKASGWAFKEAHKINIDTGSRRVTYGTASEPIAEGTIRETPEGWCVDTAALARWFGIGVKPATGASALMLESEAKLPVELAIERQKRAAQLKPAKFDTKTLPQVKLPYRMWRAPALDFVVSAGITYNAHTGTRVDRRTSLFAAGEIAHLSYDAQLSTNEKGVPSALRLRAFRSDPDGQLLGPLTATHFAVGDVIGYSSRLGGAASSGRGALVTNRPLHQPTAFDRTRFEGDLPSGWEAELYRNGELVAFARATDSQRYAFEDVQLMYGENDISIIMYGPQGQVRTRNEMVNVGQENVPAGKTWYWAGANQPGQDIVALHQSPDAAKRPKLQAAASVEHGLDERTSVGALARVMLIDDERLTFIEGSVRRSIGRALVEVGAARDSGGGTAARAQLLAKFGSVNVSADALMAKDFHLQGTSRQTVKDVRLAVDAPIRLGRTTIPAHADVRMLKNGDGSSQIEAAGRLSANINRFNLATDIRYRRQFVPHGRGPPGDLEVALLGSGRIGDVRVRGQATAEVAPQARLRSAEVSAYWSAGENSDFEGAIGYDASGRRALGRVSYIRRLNTMAVALTGEAASDGSVALGVNLNFSLDPTHGFAMSRQPLAGAGAVRALVYRDLNDNGIRDADEPREKGALITTGARPIEKPTDSKGTVMVAGLATYTPVAIGIDAGSLADPMLVPKKALQVVTPRPGVPVEVEIGLVGGGDVEGSVVKSGGLGFEGLTLELVDASGKIISTTQSDFDGFFLFERVPYGSYKVRVAADSAAAARIATDLNTVATVSDAKAVARLGSLSVTPLPTIASADAAKVAEVVSGDF